MNKSWRFYLIIWLIATVACAVSGAAMLNARKYYLLSDRGVLTEGRVTDTDPENHRTVHYEYSINQKTYRWGGHAGDINRRFEEIRPGDKVPVVYDPLNPESSCLGDPNDELRSLIHGIIFISLFPTLALLSYFIRKDIRQRREVA